MFWNKENVAGGAISPPMGILNKIDKGILYFFIISVPLFIYPFSISGWTLIPRVARELYFYSFGIIILTYLQDNRFLRYLIMWCVVNYWLNFFLPKESGIYLFNIVSALSIYIGTKYLIKKRLLNINVILRIICLIVIFQFLWMLMQKYFHYDPVFYPVNIEGIKDTSRPVNIVGWMGNTSILGVFFACNIFLLLNYFKIRKVPFLFLIILPAFIFIHNFTTILCFIVGMATYLMLRYKKYSKKYKIFAVIFLIILIVIFAFYIKHPNFDRIYIWKKLIKDGLKIRPFVGCGLNFFSHLQIIDKTGTPWYEAHNEYLQMILEIGSIGFVLFCGFIISKLVYFLKYIRENKEIAMFSCLIAFLVSGISLFPFHLAQISIYPLIIWACLEATIEKRVTVCISA